VDPGILIDFTAGTMNLPFLRNCRSKRFIILLALLLCVSFSVAQDDGYDFVKEVLDEGKDNDDDAITDESAVQGNATASETHEEKIRRKQKEAELKKKAEEERIARERAERIEQEREAAFAAEVAKMTVDDQKAARKQKKKDARIVRRILRAAKHDNHYAVLGLRNWEIIMSSRTIKLVTLVLRMPEIALFHITPKTIKKAYRKLARSVHPDKNRDGRAEEAFIAVENAASILTDEAQRLEYDSRIREIRQNRRKEATKKVFESVDGTLRFFGRFVKVFRRVLGPFALPVFILAALLI
jgi:Skp family chaperone for outer membrane proteins